MDDLLEEFKVFQSTSNKLVKDSVFLDLRNIICDILKEQVKLFCDKCDKLEDFLFKNDYIINFSRIIKGDFEVDSFDDNEIILYTIIPTLINVGSNIEYDDIIDFQLTNDNTLILNILSNEGDSYIYEIPYKTLFNLVDEYSKDIVNESNDYINWYETKILPNLEEKLHNSIIDIDVSVCQTQIDKHNLINKIKFLKSISMFFTEMNN